MAQQPKTGTAGVVSMSDFLAKAKKLAEAKPLDPPPKRSAQNFGAATRRQWARPTVERKPSPESEGGEQAPTPDEAPEAR